MFLSVEALPRKPPSAGNVGSIFCVQFNLLYVLEQPKSGDLQLLHRPSTC